MTSPESFSQKQLIHNFDKAASSFDTASFLFQEINQRMVKRLEVMTLEPKWILDCGCGTGFGSQLLLKKFKKAYITSFDISSKMLQQAKSKKTWRQKDLFVQGAANQLPFANNSFDFVYANLMLHWCDDISAIFSEWQRVLKPEGLLMFTAFGPDTFKELYAAINTINPNQKVQSFIDMHNLGDALIKHQLLDPVMDVENFQINYSSPKKFLAELRALGGRNLHPHRQKHLFTKQYKRLLEKKLQEVTNIQGKTPITIEVIYGHAWNGDIKFQSKQGDSVSIPLHLIKRHKS